MKASVLMPTYNDERSIRDAVDSILSQTFADFELVVVNDGSTDATARILAEYADPRIRIITHEKNLGRPHARNSALDAAKGEYIFWMDTDDISLPTRLEKQIAFMDAHPDIAVCGGAIQCFSGSDKHIPFARKTLNIATDLFFGATIANPASCIRRSAVKQFGIRYNTDLPRAQDYEFWCRMLLDCRLKGANLSEMLLLYRVRVLTHAESHKDVFRLILRRLGLEESDARLRIYLEFCLAATREELTHSPDEYMAFVRKVLEANELTKVFDQTLLSKRLYLRAAFLICLLEPSFSRRVSWCLRVLGLSWTLRGCLTLGTRCIVRKAHQKLGERL